MAEEFAEFINKLNKEPIEKQVAKLKHVVINMVDLIQRFIDKYSIEFEIIRNKMISLEAKTMITKLPEIKPLPIPPPQKKPIDKGSVRTAILEELKEIIKERK